MAKKTTGQALNTSTKTKWIIGILSTLLILAVLFIGFIFYNSYEQSKLDQAANYGYQRGVEDAVAKVMLETKNCNVVPITLNNQSIQIVDVACLKQPEPQQK